MPRDDTMIRISYKLDHPGETIVETNANKDDIVPLLGNWLLTHEDSFRDPNPYAEKRLYNITIVARANGSLFTQSNAGNKGITCDIIAFVFANLSSLHIEKLPQAYSRAS